MIARTTCVAVNQLTSHISLIGLRSLLLWVPGFHLSFSANWWPSVWHDEDFRSRYALKYIFIKGFGWIGRIVGCLGWMKDDFLTKYCYCDNLKDMYFRQACIVLQNWPKPFVDTWQILWQLRIIERHKCSQWSDRNYPANCSNSRWSYWNNLGVSEVPLKWLQSIMNWIVDRLSLPAVASTHNKSITTIIDYPLLQRQKVIFGLWKNRFQFSN